MLAFDWLAGNRWRGGGERPHSFFPQPKPNLSCFCSLWDFENVPKLADTMNVTLGDILLAQTVFKTARETVWRHQGSGAPGRDVTQRRGVVANYLYFVRGSHNIWQYFDKRITISQKTIFYKKNNLIIERITQKDNLIVSQLTIKRISISS